MELDPGEWQLVSDPFESLRLHRSMTPLIAEEGAGTVQLLVTEDQSNPPVLLACHDFESFEIFDAEITLRHGEELLTLGECSRLGEIDAEGFWEPPFFRHPLSLTPLTKAFLRPPMKEVSYRLKSAFHTHRGTLRPEGLEALRRAIEILAT